MKKLSLRQACSGVNLALEIEDSSADFLDILWPWPNCKIPDRLFELGSLRDLNQDTISDDLTEYPEFVGSVQNLVVCSADRVSINAII
jgi:hypothetical protein